MYILSSFTDQVERVCKVVLFLLFVIMVTTTFAQVVFRFFSDSLGWSGELAKYCLIWLTFVGSALGVRKRIHVAVEALTIFFPPGLQRLAARCNYLLLIALAGILVKYGFALAAFNMKQQSPAMHIPMGIPYAAIPVGGLMIMIFTLEMLIDPETGRDVAE